VTNKDQVFTTNRQKVINYNDSTIHLHITPPPNILINQNNNKQYHWFLNGKIGMNIGGFTGNLLCKDYLVFDSYGRLRTKGYFNLGLKHGIWIKWNSNGEILSSENWKYGHLHNLSYYYNIDNNETLRLKYKNGVLHGRSIHYFENGERQVKWYRNGNESNNIFYRLLYIKRNAMNVDKDKVDE
jgi:antitoxin component YwqK of YwqJK toxin-antitoxin module